MIYLFRKTFKMNTIFDFKKEENKEPEDKSAQKHSQGQTHPQPEPQLEPQLRPNVEADSTYSHFFNSYLTAHNESKLRGAGDSQSTIVVSEVLGNIAYLYEKIRNTVEYKGEYVLRRNAIERILKRLFWERVGQESKKLSKVLIRELIWAKYLPNDSIGDNKIQEIGVTIDKYIYFVGKLKDHGTSVSFEKIREWVWGVASCEIEERLDPSNREPYVLLMYKWFDTYFKWSDKNVSEHERSIQIYLAIHRSLTKSDYQIMRYHLLLKEFPDWKNATPEMVNLAVEKFHHLYEEIEKHLQYKHRNKLYRIVQRQTAPFEILRDLCKKYDAKVLQIIANEDDFEMKIRELCQLRYIDIKKKINRGIVRSIVYIFITKITFALLIEVPYDLYYLGHITYIPLGINIIVPPLLMFLLGMTIKAPGEDNTQRIIKKIRSIVFRNPHVAATTFSLSKVRRTNILSSVFSMVYAIIFLFVFGGITLLLINLNFTIVGMFIFFAFLSLVLLFGFRVKFTAMEMNVKGERQGFIEHLFTNITLPFLNTGVYLSKGLSKINFFTAVLDFLIEAPLKTIIEVLEEWTSFMREKQEEVVEIPQE